MGRPKINWIEDTMAEAWKEVKHHFPHEPQDYGVFFSQKEAIQSMAMQRREPFATKAQAQRNENAPQDQAAFNGNDRGRGRGRGMGRGGKGKGRRGRGIAQGKGKSWTEHDDRPADPVRDAFERYFR